MPPVALYPWAIYPAEAIQLQERLQPRLVLTWDGRPVRSIAGVDATCVGEVMHAAVAVFTYPSLAPILTVTSEAPLHFPYIPGLLAFRTGPAILAAWDKLPDKPDLLMFHGHGTAHPRGFGLASHLGLWLGTPAIGVAKTRLYGHAVEIDLAEGEWCELLSKQEPYPVIGAVLRTRAEAKPVYVSPGYLIDLEQSIAFVLACCRGHRLPEPIRAAHTATRIG